jgi:hypothetical protein
VYAQKPDQNDVIVGAWQKVIHFLQDMVCAGWMHQSED